VVFAFEPAHACLPSQRCLDHCSGVKEIAAATKFMSKSRVCMEMVLTQKFKMHHPGGLQTNTSFCSACSAQTFAVVFP
jgi:hypothetical protein